MPLRIVRILDFWNFPRWFVVATPRFGLYLHNGFDSEKDDYDSVFEVYLIPADATAPVWGPWPDIHSSWRLLGTIEVTDLEFDETARITIQRGPALERLIEACGLPTTTRH
jgi:hypothetical protein